MKVTPLIGPTLRSTSGIAISCRDACPLGDGTSLTCRTSFTHHRPPVEIDT